MTADITTLTVDAVVNSPMKSWFVAARCVRRIGQLALLGM